MSEVKKTEKVKAYEPWEDMRTVFVHGTKTEQKTLMVSINNKRYRVPKGKWVEVPFPVYDVIRNREDQLRKVDEDAERDFKEVIEYR